MARYARALAAIAILTAYSALAQAPSDSYPNRAVKILVPWDAANVPHDFSARLVTEDGGDPVLATSPEGPAVPTPIEFQGRFEAGRPPGLAPGSQLDAPFAVNIAGLPLPSGRYEWQVAIDAELVDRVAFTVMA